MVGGLQVMSLGIARISGVWLRWPGWAAGKVMLKCDSKHLIASLSRPVCPGLSCMSLLVVEGTLLV
jgi:hypothetical protein